MALTHAEIRYAHLPPGESSRINLAGTTLTEAQVERLRRLEVGVSYRDLAGSMRKRATFTLERTVTRAWNAQPPEDAAGREPDPDWAMRGT